MIHFNFKISNPWSNRFNNLLSRNGKFSKHKAWEVNVYKTDSVISIFFSLNVKRDHAGVQLVLGVLGYECEANLYDTRHWDYENNCWRNYDNS
jgi:hypothetical protein